MEHLGMPYRVVDLYHQRLTEKLLDECAGVVLAQARVGAFLTKEENRRLADAVHGGLGLVSFDNDLRNYDGAYLEMFGFDEINPHPYASNIFRVRDADHYITKMQSAGELHYFDKMVTAIAVGKWGRNVKPLADCILAKEQLVYIRHITPWSAFEPRNWPAAFAARWGSGRAVQFTISPRMWKREFFGHARGADDLFWRSLVWAAKKPFLSATLPPFVTMSFDDCSGRHELDYVSAVCRHGYIPMPSLFLGRVDEGLFPKIREQQLSGKVEYNTHAINYYDHMYHAYGRGPYSKEELDRHFAFEDAFWGRVGVKPVNTVRFHCGEMGVNALPYLKKRNRFFINPALQTGLLKADMCMADGYYPYNLQNRYYDYMPDDHDFFAFNSMLPRFSEDFLAGCTVNLMENPTNDTEKAAKGLANQIRRGLRDGFYTDAVTHEQKFEDLSLDEWEKILTRADELTADLDLHMASHDRIGQYLKDKDNLHLVEVTRKQGVLSAVLTGKTEAETCLSVFTGDDEIERSYVRVPAFSERIRV
jgi:hypothetical protein